MRFSLGDKAQRVLKLMLGLRNARVAAAMATHGFTNADLQEGWQLLQGVSRAKLDTTTTKAASSETIDKLDAWENRWFPIAAATVERRFPAVHAQLFNNLSQTSGPEIAVSVRTFLERFDAMAAAAAPYGVEGTAAKTVLEARGLTRSVLDEARALLETTSTIAEKTVTLSTLEEDQADLAKAEEALWAWYLEWSQIARIAVKQRALLRQMGFGGSKGRGANEPETDGDEIVNPTTGVIAPSSPVL